MSQVDLVYAHVPCPRCGEQFIPLKAYVTPCDYDEDGHANGIEVDTITCATCGELHEEADSICDQIIDAFFHMTDYDSEKRPIMMEIGTIYSYHQKTQADQEAIRARAEAKS